MIIKQRQKANAISQMDLVGSVENCDVIIVDDMIDTAGTLCKAASALKQHGGSLDLVKKEMSNKIGSFLCVCL